MTDKTSAPGNRDKGSIPEIIVGKIWEIAPGPYHETFEEWSKRNEAFVERIIEWVNIAEKEAEARGRMKKYADLESRLSAALKVVESAKKMRKEFSVVDGPYGKYVEFADTPAVECLKAFDAALRELDSIQNPDKPE